MVLAPLITSQIRLTATSMAVNTIFSSPVRPGAAVSNGVWVKAKMPEKTLNFSSA